MSLSVLIVEDSPTQAELLRHALETHGCTVVVAPDGNAALKQLRTEAPRVVISDIVMPGMDGYELCRRIKSDPSLREVQVFLLTSLSDSETVVRSLECGADSFILKPWNEEFLLSRLNQAGSQAAPGAEQRRDFQIELNFHGKQRLIRAEPHRVINLLLSTYEAAVSKQRELQEAQKQLQSMNEHLEQMVAERTARLNESVRSLEGFCYSIAHDLRAPLRAMEGFSSVLLEDYACAFDDEGRDYAKRIASAASRMDHLIRDLLAFGRLNHAELPLTAVNPETVLNQVLQNFSTEIQSRNAQIHLQSPFPSVLANAVVLEQVLGNLVGNALKFVNSTATPRVDITSQIRGDNVRLNIRDNGIGIGQEHLERIFRVFERLHTNEAYSGTGIGLAIVRKGAERMGGAVGVESTPGEGSAFWIELKRAQDDGESE